MFFVFFFKQKTAYEMRISDWSSDVCSSDLLGDDVERAAGGVATEENALRTAQNLDAFNVEQILIARRRTRDVDTVVMDRRAGIGRNAERGGADSTNIDDRHGIVGDRHARHEKLQVFDVGYARCRKRLAGHRCRSEEHTSELQSLMRISYAVFCLKKKTNNSSTVCSTPS